MLNEINTQPDIMNEGHQDWLKGLAKIVLAAKGKA